MATGAETTIFYNLLQIMGGSTVLLSILAMGLSVVILMLLRIPIQIQLPLISIMLFVSGGLAQGWSMGVLWIIGGVVLALFLYSIARGW